MSNFQRLVPAFLAVTAGIATGYYVVAPEYAPGGAGAEVIPPEQRKNTPVPPISSSSAFDKVSPPMTANAGQKDLLEDKAALNKYNLLEIIIGIWPMALRVFNWKRDYVGRGQKG
ncbi:uncharacterized protein IAS62_002274 [Cryptococcus decagattii]|uniref:Uncharacterized protein n=2 Tax=Cryptococcus gattii species complex TaxID=1884637 RepID=A0ABZ2AUW2_9TREE